MLNDIFTKIKSWFSKTSANNFNIKVSQKALKNLAPGKVIIFNNLPELVYNELIGKSIDIERLQFEVKLEVRYNEEGFEYKEFKLEDNGLEFWLETVRDMGTWTLSLWKRLPDIDKSLYLEDGKIKDALQFENQNYKQDATGLTHFQMLDEQNPTDGTIRYWRFQCEEDPKKSFAVSDWMNSGQYECAKGEWIKERDFEILVFSASF